MLKELHTVLPASNLDRAKNYYHDVLGMDPAEVHEGMIVYRPMTGSAFEIYETSNAGTAQNTQMGWVTDDLEAEMASLRDRGVVFEEYDVPGLKTVDGMVATEEMKSAWFRDSEGNFLCISEMLA